MRKELDEKLVKDFPLLFCDRYGKKTETCMYWGFSCGDGWEPIIRKASEKLEPLIKKWIKKNPKNKYHPRAAQIKEKFGTLRLYLSHGTEKMEEIAFKAEEASAKVCEKCGQPGKWRNDGWYETSCDYCFKNREE